MMNRISHYSRESIFLLLLAGMISSAHAADMKPEDLVAKHLDSIGTAQARAAIKTRAVQGALKFRILVGGGGETGGTWGRVTDGAKSNFVMKFGVVGHTDWWGEQFVFDGDKTSFAAPSSNHQWSVFARFVHDHDLIVKESLLGGELSAGWALQNLEHVKLESLGRKKIDGRDTECIGYHSKGQSDLVIKLYFDAETFHHVMTVYTLESAAGVASHSPLDSPSQQDTRYKIEERFSDFKTDNGITLPRHYQIEYSRELQDGSTLVYQWEMTADKTAENLTMDPANFHLK